MSNCAVCSQPAGYRRSMPGEKGWRSPLPNWWVDEANDRLRRRQLQKKILARALIAQGHPVSETMVLRALHSDPLERLASLQTIEAISDALHIPRPVIVATSLAEALELQRMISFNAADAERLRIVADAQLEKGLRTANKPVVDGSDGRTKAPRAVGDGRQEVDAGRRPKVRRGPRTR